MYSNFLLTGVQKGQKIAVSPIDEVGFSPLTELQICQKLFSRLFLICLYKDQKTKVVVTFSTATQH